MSVCGNYMNELLEKFKDDKNDDIEDFPKSYPSSADDKWEACIKKLFNKKRSKKFVIAALLGSCNVMTNVNDVKEYCKDLAILTKKDATLKRKDYIKEAESLRKNVKLAKTIPDIKKCLVEGLPKIENQLRDIKLSARLIPDPPKNKPKMKKVSQSATHVPPPPKNKPKFKN